MVSVLRRSFAVPAVAVAGASCVTRPWPISGRGPAAPGGDERSQ
jgi:hypothetical protein